LYQFETFFLTLKKEHRLRVKENRMLRRVFALEREEMRKG
jgi:hypothetical protein